MIYVTLWSPTIWFMTPLHIWNQGNLLVLDSVLIISLMHPFHWNSFLHPYLLPVFVVDMYQLLSEMLLFNLFSKVRIKIQLCSFYWQYWHYAEACPGLCVILWEKLALNTESIQCVEPKPMATRMVVNSQLQDDTSINVHIASWWNGVCMGSILSALTFNLVSRKVSLHPCALVCLR